MITEITQYKTGWLSKPDIRDDTWIDVDLEKSSLLIKTDSAEGSSDRLSVWLRSADNEEARIVNITFGSPPTYSLKFCAYSYEFQTKIPSERIKVWRITFTRNPESTLVIHCNNKEVLKIVISSSICYEKNWETYWGKDVQKILFSYDDSASDYYSFYTMFDTGNLTYEGTFCVDQNILEYFACACMIMHNLISRTLIELNSYCGVEALNF